VVLATAGAPQTGGPRGKRVLWQGRLLLRRVRWIFFRNKTVAVVGGGDSAIEESLYLAKLARQVYIIHRRDQLRAGMLLQQRAKAECKIEFIWNSVVAAVKANADGVYAVDVKNTRSGKRANWPRTGCLSSSVSCRTTGWCRPASSETPTAT